MFNPSLLERIIHKIKTVILSFTVLFRKSRLLRKDFTIISNNCWGGVCYEYFGLPKNSPTVGCFFFAKDYLKFVQNLKYYLNIDMKFISIDQSIHKDLLKKRSINCPVGVLDDVEIFFLHYVNADIAKDKWNRRVKRINWGNLVFKFSQMNECSAEDLEKFDKMSLPGKKIMFVKQPNHPYLSGVYYPGYENDEEISNDTFYWNRYINVYNILNSNEIK